MHASSKAIEQWQQETGTCVALVAGKLFLLESFVSAAAAAASDVERVPVLVFEVEIVQRSLAAGNAAAGNAAGGDCFVEA